MFPFPGDSLPRTPQIKATLINHPRPSFIAPHPGTETAYGTKAQRNSGFRGGDWIHRHVFRGEFSKCGNCFWKVDA